MATYYLRISKSKQIKYKKRKSISGVIKQLNKLLPYSYNDFKILRFRAL